MGVARYRFPPMLAGKAIHGFLYMARLSRGRRFIIGGFIVIPKITVLCISEDYCVMLDVFSEKLESIHSVIFDASGLHDRYLTQVEIRRDGTVVISPSEGRQRIRLEQLFRILAEATEKNNQSQTALPPLRHQLKTHA